MTEDLPIAERRPHVVILQHRLLHYRVGLFERLRERCGQLGIRLDVVAGQATTREALKRDEGELPWVFKVRNSFLALPSRDLLWQPFPPEFQDADLVVLMQESRIISNYPLLVRRWLGGKQRVGYWGHGRNFQSRARAGLRERWKRFLIGRVDWWFAYTPISAELVAQTGFPTDRITCLNNAIDTDQFRADLASIDSDEIALARRSLHLSEDCRVLLFCGSLYVDKRLDLLVHASDIAYRAMGNLALVVVGDGPSMPALQEFASTRPWLKIVGSKRGRDKALYYRMAELILNPGAVGLHVLDAFAAGLVMITTRAALHGPEIAYLRDGSNGLALDDNPEAISGAITELFRNPKRLRSMQANAAADADVFTIDNMVESFTMGILAALGTEEFIRP